MTKEDHATNEEVDPWKDIQIETNRRWRRYIGQVALGVTLSLGAALAVVSELKSFFPSFLTAQTALFFGLAMTVGALLKWYLDTGLRKDALVEVVESEERREVPPHQTESMPHNDDGSPLRGSSSLDAPQSPMQLLTWEVVRHQLRSEKRLEREIGHLNRRGNTNLAIGAGTAFAGILGLLWISMILPATTKENWPWMFLSAFVPRLTTVLILEVFAFFFLSLYKAGLSEVKYYQNELTNLGGQALALTLALERNDKETIAKVVLRVAETERNFVLRKDETTPDLKRAEIERASTATILKEISTIVRGVSGTKAEGKEKD